MMDGSIPPPLSISSSSSSSAAVFRPRRSDDWNEYRTVIEKLYRDDHLKLRDVKTFMESEYKFVASEKQYKDRLAAWKCRKNIKAKEVHIMIRKQQKRAARGKQTAFRINNEIIEPKRIARFVRRYGPDLDNHPRDGFHQISPEPKTPTGMECFTPEPDERGSTLSPLPERQSHHDDDKPVAVPECDIDDNQSLTATLSPSLPPNETPKTLNDTHAEDPWKELISFQDRLLVLQQRLDESMSGFTSPHDD